MLSFTALMLPGKFIIRVLFLMPLTPLDNSALGVFFWLSALRYSEIPGASRSIAVLVASGVTSRGEKPVPPVVIIKSELRLSQISLIAVSYTHLRAHATDS